NDLTQMTFGFSRDDVEGRMMSAYLDKGLLAHNPFEVIDADGVGELVRVAVARGRESRPELKIGVCGEHGGDPESIAFFASAGLDYVSCSPFRVPIARLSAAHAVLASASPAGRASGRTGSPAKRSPAKKRPAKKRTADKSAAKKRSAKKSGTKKAGTARSSARRATARQGRRSGPRR
ncbi:MAG TPA: pyruvate, phosphate dikinase, partial [Acidimicrobiaceae bacterium]|nr:pyruvate, phosphate dikinase [Acidimicrobiaceae bacterium]